MERAELHRLEPMFCQSFTYLAARIGRNPCFYKPHDIFHVRRDIQLFGSSRTVSTGMHYHPQASSWAQGLTFGCSLHAVTVLVETYEGYHKVVKKVYRASSRRPGGLEAELLEKLLRKEFYNWVASGCCVPLPVAIIMMLHSICCHCDF